MEFTLDEFPLTPPPPPPRPPAAKKEEIAARILKIDKGVLYINEDRDRDVELFTLSFVEQQIKENPDFLQGKNCKVVQTYEDISGKRHIEAFGDDEAETDDLREIKKELNIRAPEGTEGDEETLSQSDGRKTPRIFFYDVNERGNTVLEEVDYSNISIGRWAISREEYERYRDATFQSFQDLSAFYKALNSEKQKLESGEKSTEHYPLRNRVDFPRAKSQVKDDKKELEEVQRKKEAEIRRIKEEQEIQESIDEGKVQKKKELNRAILKTYDTLLQFRVVRRNIEAAQNGNIKNDFKVINRN